MDFSKTEMVTPETSLNMSMGAFLASLKLESLREIFDREHINVEILADMGHEDLRQIGITAFGHRRVSCTLSIFLCFMYLLFSSNLCQQPCRAANCT